MRILHFSDVHVQVPWMQLPKDQFLNKRLIGASNLALRRRKRFADAEHKLQQLASFMRTEHVDLSICTGDFTALGTEPEMIAARRAINPLTKAPLGFVTLPGNHDVYLRDVLRDGRFERTFGDLLITDVPEMSTDGVWPLVRFFGDVAVIAVNSARPNPEPWLSSGEIPSKQLCGLESALLDPRIRDRFVIVATHYAPCLMNGRPDSRRHGLDNADALLSVCQNIQKGMLLCGHIHRRFSVTIPGMQIPLYCSGSATHQGHEGFWVYELDDRSVSARAGLYRDGSYCYETQI